MSYGKIKEKKNNYEIIHLCSTEIGSSGSPILNLSNNKVIGIHSRSYEKYNFNIGFSLQYPIKEYLNTINLLNKKHHNSQDDFRKYYYINKEYYKSIYFYFYEVKEKETNEKKAIKLLYKDELKIHISFWNRDDVDINEKMKPFINDLMKYIETMKTVEEKNAGIENIVKYYEYFENEKEFVIVMELCDYNLIDYLFKREKPFNIEEIYNLLFQLNNAFKLFSENKILGYVTLDNIFIKEDKNKNLIFKLSNNFLEDRFRDRIISRFDRAPNINDVFLRS